MTSRFAVADVTPCTRLSTWLSAASRTASFALHSASIRMLNAKGFWIASGRRPSTTPFATLPGCA